VTVGIDLDVHCRFAYEANNPEARFIHADISEVDATALLPMLAGADAVLLAGCAPCQPFSTYSRTGQRSKDWGLLGEFQRLALALLPDYVTMENVPGLTKHAVYRDFVAALEAAGYHVTTSEAFCPAYGVPQTRTRLVVLASRHGPLAFPSPTHRPEDYPTVRTVLDGLPPLAAGACDPDDPIHRAAGLSPLNLRRIRASRPGGTWHDWPSGLRAKCHQRDTGRSFVGVYGRMRWDEPAPTITTESHGYGNGRFGHPEQDRAISLREAALLQTFPRDYQFVAPGKPIYLERVCRHIGNAVPVRLGECIAQVVRTDANWRLSACPARGVA
jgi:DNA (cytosine-5)-methyltransferase 1